MTNTEFSVFMLKLKGWKTLLRKVFIFPNKVQLGLENAFRYVHILLTIIFSHGIRVCHFYKSLDPSQL